MTILDSYSAYSLLQFIHLKSEAGDAVIEMITELEKLFCRQTSQLATISRNCIRWLELMKAGDILKMNFRSGLRNAELFMK